MILNDWAAITIIACTVAVCVLIGFTNESTNKRETAKAAAAAGLVQKVVKLDGYNPIVIWVKPGVEP